MKRDSMRLPFATPAEITAALPRVVEQLHADALIAYPTETVYGFGGAATSDATAALRTLKGRDPFKPFLLLVADAGQATGVLWSETARTVAELFWPGPLTLVMPAIDGAFPEGVIGADGTVALRASPHPAVRALVGAWGAPLTSTSANAPAQAPARSGAETAAVLGALAAADVLLLDGGSLPVSPPSTIVRCGEAVVTVLRHGAVSSDVMRDRLRGNRIDVE